MASPLDQNTLDHLHNTAMASVSDMQQDESTSYAVLAEMIIEHRAVLGRGFLLFPQLRLLWNPKNPRDERANVGLGRLTPDGFRLQGGAEQKAPVTAMRGFPNPTAILDDSDLRRSMIEATIQGEDQVKTAIKNGALPLQVPIEWIIAVGPYFSIVSFGPFAEAELMTRGHRPNDGGDAGVAEMFAEYKRTARFNSITAPLYRIGDPEAALAMHGYLSSITVDHLYTSTNRTSI